MPVVADDVLSHNSNVKSVSGGDTLSFEEIQEKIRWGYRFLNVGSVVGYGAQVLKQNLEILRDDPRGEK